RFTRTTLFCILLFGQIVVLNAQSLEVQNLAVDHLLHTDLQVVNGYAATGSQSNVGERPLIPNKQPMLGWELVGAKSGAAQSAYRIIVSNEPDSVKKGVGNIWDSNKVGSDESSNILFQGQALQPLTTYY